MVELTKLPFLLPKLFLALIADTLDFASTIIPWVLNGLASLCGFKSETFTKVVELSKVPFGIATDVIVFINSFLDKVSKIIPSAFDKFMGLFDYNTDSNIGNANGNDLEEESDNENDSRDSKPVTPITPVTTIIAPQFDHSKQQTAEEVKEQAKVQTQQRSQLPFRPRSSSS